MNFVYHIWKDGYRAQRGNWTRAPVIHKSLPFCTSTNKAGGRGNCSPKQNPFPHGGQEASMSTCSLSVPWTPRELFNEKSIKQNWRRNSFDMKRFKLSNLNRLKNARDHPLAPQHKSHPWVAQLPDWLTVSVNHATFLPLPLLQ